MNVYKQLLVLRSVAMILSYLQVNKLVCHSFVEADQKQISWVSDKGQFITQSKSSSQRTIMFLHHFSESSSYRWHSKGQVTLQHVVSYIPGEEPQALGNSSFG